MKPLHGGRFGVDFLGLAFVLIWSSGYVVGSLATEVIAPLAVTLWRFAVAAAVLAAIAWYRHERWPRGRELWALVGIGVPMIAVQFGALYTAMADGMPASTTSLIACSSPLAVAVFSSLAGWERLTARQWLGILLGVLGVSITLADRVGPLRGSVALPLTAHALLSFTWLATVSGVGAPLLLFALIRQRGATRASSFLFVVPAVTAIAAWPILGTPIGRLTLVGLVVVGVALRLARSSTSAPACPPARSVTAPVPVAARLER